MALDAGHDPMSAQVNARVPFAPRAAFGGALRPATAADVVALGRLAAELVRAHHADDPERFLLPSGVEESYRRWLGSELRNDDAIVLVAEAGAEIIGYVYGRLERGDARMLLEQHAALRQLLVSRRARRQRVAHALVRRFVSIASERGMSRVVLHTATTNVRAQGLFRQLGFAPTMLEMTLRTRASLRLAPEAPRSGA